MQRMHGLVVQVSSPYIGSPRPNMAGLLLRILLWVLIFIAILPFIIAFWVMRDILSSKPRTYTGPGLLQQVFGYWLGIKLWNQSPMLIRDFRVRESATGRIGLVRIHGQLIEGDIVRGDTVTILGDDLNGTLLFQEGMNHTIRSRIALQ